MLEVSDLPPRYFESNEYKEVFEMGAGCFHAPFVMIRLLPAANRGRQQDPTESLGVAPQRWTDPKVPTLKGLLRTLSFAIVLLLTPAAYAAHPRATTPPEPDTVFGFSSAPGESVGQGQTGKYTTSNATFSISGNSAAVTISIQALQTDDSWTIEFAAPVGEPLHPRTYPDAELIPATGRAPGLNVEGKQRCLNTLWGEFGLRQIGFDESGNVTSLDASFTQRCSGPDGPPLAGVIRYRMPQLELLLASDPGDPLAQGLHRRYDNDTSLFKLLATDPDLLFTVSGQRTTWHIFIAPPAGQSLRRGKYAISQNADATHARFDLFGNGRSCPGVTGVLDVHQVERGEFGLVNKISASFEQHCDGSAAALHGVLHYGI